MFNILIVTNRKLCRENFSERIEKISAAHPAGIILREKDLTEDEYERLAVKTLEICRKNETPCILHGFQSVAAKLDCSSLHLPLNTLRSLSDEEKTRFSTLGASCHSVEDTIEAEKLGCTYITAGHIYDTDCKKGLPGRGTEFLKSVCDSVSIPVYAIGGICPDNIAEIRSAGASGACVMSGAMVCDDVQKYLNELGESK